MIAPQVFLVESLTAAVIPSVPDSQVTSAEKTRTGVRNVRAVSAASPELFPVLTANSGGMLALPVLEG